MKPVDKTTGMSVQNQQLKLEARLKVQLTRTVVSFYFIGFHRYNTDASDKIVEATSVLS